MRSLLFTIFLVAASHACGADAVPDPYDVLYDTIMVRKTADGGLVKPEAETPLLWRDSRYLLDDVTLMKLMEALDRFNSLSQEQVDSYPPLNRAILQYHVWTVFDWTTTLAHSSEVRQRHFLPHEVFKVQNSLVATIKKLALSDTEIARLPNSLEVTVASGEFPEVCDASDAMEPYLPRDIYADDGPWICLRKADSDVPAKLHTESVSSRSAFLIFLRLPDGRQATLDYLHKLAAFRLPWVPGEREPSANNPRARGDEGSGPARQPNDSTVSHRRPSGPHKTGVADQ